MGEHIGHMAAKGMDGWGKPGIRKRKADVLTNRTIIINTRWQQLIAIRTLHLLHSLINQPHWKLFIRNTLIYNRPMTINHPCNAHRCAGSPIYLRQWDSSSCSCKCRSSPLECAPGLHWYSANCRCHRYLRIFVFVFDI